MSRFLRMLVIAAVPLSPLPLSAQTAPDPSGHWEGVVHVPDNALTIEIDVTRNKKGELAGTFGQPGDGVKGLPLATVGLEGKSLRFVVKGGEGAATFVGVISDDGKSMAGDLAQAGYTIPFTMTRTGDARIAPAPKSPPIAKELEGTWTGTLNVDGKQLRLELKLANGHDGTSSGTIVSPEGSGVEIPIAMAQDASRLSIAVASVGASYVGVLNAAGTEMVGTWTQKSSALPLTFRRASR